MAIAAMSMPPAAQRIFSDPNYLPLEHGEYIAQSEDLLSIQRDTKANILTKQRDAWTRKLRGTRKKYAAMTGWNSALIDQLFNGKIFDVIGNQFASTTGEDSSEMQNLMATDLTPAEIKAYADKFNKDIQKLDEFTTTFDTFMNDAFAYEKIVPILEEYATKIMEKIAASEGVPIEQAAENSQVALKIVEAFLAKKFSVFTVKSDDSNNGLEKWLIRAWALYKAIPNLGSLDGVTMKVAHNRPLKPGEDPETATGEAEIISAAAGKLYGALTNFKGVSAEGAALVALQPVIEELKRMTEETVKDFEVNLASTGNQSGVSVRVKVDKNELNQYLEDMDQIESIISSLGKRGKMKGDVSFVFSDAGGVMSRLGLSVKEYSNVKFNETKGAVPVVSGDFSLQKGTSLYILLNREIGFSTSTIMNLQKILAVKDPDYESTFNQMWDDIKTNALLYGFTNMLTGQLAGLQDTAYYLVLSGRVYSISTVLNSIVRSLRENPQGGISMSMTQVEGEGLQRSSYQALNEKVPPLNKKDIIAARQRSNSLRGSLTSLMQNTKVSVSVNLLNLAMRSVAIL